MAEKEYKSYRQQVNILRSRGMVINKGFQSSRVMRIIESENYYNVINGYKEPFLVSKATANVDEAYKTGTTFDEVYALYNFDRELRIIYYIRNERCLCYSNHVCYFVKPKRLK